MDKKENNAASTEFAPVVSVLGHVDHGKTTLLDKIRKTGVASHEHGGITQKIGASQIEIEPFDGAQGKHEGRSRKITFIDTPGHEAFANMRSQGVNAGDLVLLVVAADDGIKPQTQESIGKIKEANTPCIVVFTKIDLETANIEKVRRQVIKEGILLEGLGGDVPYIGVSSKTGEKIKDLLDLILLVYDLAEIKKDKNADFMGVVIDSKLDKSRGVVATLVVKQGTITTQNDLFAHGIKIGRVRAMSDPSGKNTSTAVPGDAVEILGISAVVPAGTVLFDKQVEPTKVADKKLTKTPPQDIMKFLEVEEPESIPVILKTETNAEMEAVKNSLPEKIRLIVTGQGDIGVSDILMAKDFKALVIGFNVDIDSQAKQLADTEHVFYKSYRIIYELLDELSQLILAINTKKEERELGRAQILASFVGSAGPILGVKVTEGRLAIGDKIKIMRQEKEMGEAQITSIKKGKEDVKQAPKNSECGIMIKPDVDFAPGDAIIAYSKRASY